MSLVLKSLIDLLNGKEIYPFADMTLAPVWLEDVVQLIDSLIQSKQRGLFHLSGKRKVKKQSKKNLHKK